jgi:hypothetical protein
MRSAILTLVAAVVVTGTAYGQQPNEHLKGYTPFIGTWRYEGPVPEEVPGIAKKGSHEVVVFSWKWILDKQAVMHDWLVELEGGTVLTGKALIGWNAAENRIVRGTMDSMGGMNMGTIELEGKTIKFVVEGVTGEGEETSGRVVFKKTDKDTLSFQRLGVIGGLIEGDSPVYTFKRVKPAKGKEVADASPQDHLKELRPLLGTWRYEGPLLEDVPGVAEKGSNYKFQSRFRFILGKQVMMEEWTVEFAGGEKFMVKGMTGWNAAENKLVNGAMDSAGGMNLGTLEIDREAKTFTLTTKGSDGEGKPFSLKATGKKLDKNTLTWQALERTGGMVQGKSPVYTLKRVKRTGKKATK